MRDHTRLHVWQKSCQLVVDVYRITRTFPSDERYGLRGQMRRAAVSVAPNIAEGASRDSKKEFIRFLSLSAGSSAELDTQLHVAGRLSFLDPPEVDRARDQVAEARRMLVGLKRAVRDSD